LQPRNEMENSNGAISFRLSTWSWPGVEASYYLKQRRCKLDIEV
jgi:hypothetical protein